MRALLACALLLTSSAMGQEHPAQPIRTGDINTRQGGTTVVGNGNRLVLGHTGPVHLKRDVRSTALDEIVRLHATAEGYRAILAFDVRGLPDDPKTSSAHLLTPTQLFKLDEILSILKRYVESLVDLNEGTSYYSLDDAVAASNLSNINLTKPGQFTFLFSNGDSPLSSPEADSNGLATSVKSLAAYLAQTNKPKTRAAMFIAQLDPSIHTLCHWLGQVLSILMGISMRDFDVALDTESMMLRGSSGKVSAEDLSSHIRNLPLLQETSAELVERLMRIQYCLAEIDLAHHNMAALYSGIGHADFRESILALLAPAQSL